MRDTQATRASESIIPSGGRVCFVVDGASVKKSQWSGPRLRAIGDSS